MISGVHLRCIARDGVLWKLACLRFQTDDDLVTRASPLYLDILELKLLRISPYYPQECFLCCVHFTDITPWSCLRSRLEPRCSLWARETTWRHPMCRLRPSADGHDGHFDGTKQNNVSSKFSAKATHFLFRLAAANASLATATPLGPMFPM